MCGIAGFSLSERDLESINPRNLTNRLALSIEHRGHDATGFAYADAGELDTIWYNKAPLAATSFVQKGWTKGIPRGARTMMVHTRAATQGSPSVGENNHPIHVPEFGGRPTIVGIHNGMLWNDDAVWRAYPELEANRQAQVDSEIIFQLIAHRGIDALKVLEGDASIAWASPSEPDQLHLAKLGGRELHVVQTVGGSFIFASTANCLIEAMKGYRQLDYSGDFHMENGEHLTIVHGKIVERRMDAPVLTLARAYKKTWNGWGDDDVTWTKDPHTGTYTERKAAPVVAKGKFTPMTEADKAQSRRSLSNGATIDAAFDEENAFDGLDRDIEALATEKVDAPFGDFSDVELALYDYYFHDVAETTDESVFDGLDFIYTHCDKAVVEELTEQLAAKLNRMEREADREELDEWHRSNEAMLALGGGPIR